MDELAQLGEAEVRRVHVWLDLWLSGRCDDEETLAPFTDALHADFTLVAPSGVMRERRQVIEDVEGGRGALGEDFVITIRKPSLRWATDDLLLVTYEEWQVLHGKDRGRLSSVLFLREGEDAQRLSWLHLHETWLPED
ncbi:MAG: hypothetical protein AAF533_00150 [Acidobacteriota bacterium]